MHFISKKQGFLRARNGARRVSKRAALLAQPTKKAPKQPGNG